MKLRPIMFLCLLLCLSIKNIFKKCLCISTETKNDSDDTNYNIHKRKTNISYYDSNALSFKNKPNNLEVIYEDIEHKSWLSDNEKNNQYIFYS